MSDVQRYIFAFLQIQVILGAFMKNKYVIDLENLMECPENAEIESPIRNLRYARINRTHRSLSMDYTLVRPIDKNVGGSVDMERWGDGGWIAIPMLGFQPNLCENMLKFFKPSWVHFNRELGVEHPDQCPIPPGNYSLKDYIMDFTGVTLPFWSGRFRFTTRYRLVDTMKVIHCVRGFLSITEVFS